MLKIIGMARSVYYYHKKQLEKPDKYRDLKRHIDNIYHLHQGRYGYRRVCLELRNQGIFVSKNTVQKIMRQLGIHGKRKKLHYRSYKGEVGKIAPNILCRDFRTDGPNRKWTTDVTQVCIHDRKIYLSPILDMWNGEIISYTISSSPNLAMILSMLNKAFKIRSNVAGLILHSDQGWQYQHRRYQIALQNNGVIQSMSRKGNCLDNSMMENFFGLMKSELFYLHKWDSIEQFEDALRKYINYYNNDRIKLRLNGMSPIGYRLEHQKSI